MLNDKGVHCSEKGIGDHVAEIKVMIPINLDKESLELFEKFAKDEPKLNSFDPSVEFYDPRNFSHSTKKTG